MSFVRGSNPVWFMVDLTAHAFDDTFYMFVLENTIPYIPATVYHDPDGTPWTNPIRFLANGTLPIDIFWDAGTIEDPTVYRLEFRQGPTQADPLIYLVEDYSPGGLSSGDITSTGVAIDNQITNPQFSLINFPTTLTISATDPDPIPVAPGWDLVVSGVGTVTMTQVPLNSNVGTANPTNAPYALRLQLVGWDADSIYLRQRFEQAGMLWANKTVASSVTARITGLSRDISATLVDSIGAPLAIVLDPVALTSDFVEYMDFGTLPDTTNTDFPPDAYIEYRLEIPNNVDIYLTSFQLVPQDLETNISYQQETIERQVDHTFHYYKPGLEYKPISSYLTAWNFPLNPCQAGCVATSGAIVTGANGSTYVTDQTIAFQEVDSSLSFAFTNPNGIVVTTANTTQWALIQYIPLPNAREIVNQDFSMQISAFLSSAASSDSLVGHVQVYTSTTTLPTVTSPTNQSLLAGMTAGVPTGFHGAWPLITNTAYQGEFTVLTDTAAGQQVFNFTGWEPVGGNVTFVAVVVSFASMTAAQGINIQYVTLNGGTIPSRPAPQTPDEVLRECQYYYQTSFLRGTIPAQNVGVDTGEAYCAPRTAGTVALTPGPIISFATPLRVSPGALGVTLFSPIGAGVGSQIVTRRTGAEWTLSTVVTAATTVNGFITTGTSSSGINATDFGIVHWIADARLGVV